MVIKEIQEFIEVRHKIRAYLCYIFSRNIQNFLPQITEEQINSGFDNLEHEIVHYDAMYILDKNGLQVSNNRSGNKDFIVGDGIDRSTRAYYYQAVKERRCFLSDPYPSSLTGELCVTISLPLYNEKKELQYVACVDISLKEVSKIVNPSAFEGVFGKFTRLVYTFFAAALFVVAAVLFFMAIRSLFFVHFVEMDVSEMFEATILLTLALAIFDLVKAIAEGEILGTHSQSQGSSTMVRFIASIIIALAIEALMLVFKFAIIEPEHIVYAVYLIIGVAVLMVSLSVYMYILKKVHE
ncbi:general glycosylation pathway protein [Campylobacter blaseri]|uniref:General glycosylation pathway protein n=1 Tax=Campylobacter blaseri TaxID=2042961 RepID=A0A2P8R1G4_9BACT|nr:PDC sensor domain-containing protein [Campylobacter blaseri]PSM52331.1 hypothetical protein CQ405_04565 [Campylobacter blaseri]PSM54097.1 hypothetical protein CRN67_04565 [Campylobacter blaseri]QKF85539.1 general glycosylation pathway protein [Campylobacter blaseri]